MSVSNVLVDGIFFDDLSHVLQNGLGAGNGNSGPRLEAVAKGIKIRIRADTRVFMGLPRAPKGLLHFKYAVALVWALLL